MQCASPYALEGGVEQWRLGELVAGEPLTVALRGRTVVFSQDRAAVACELGASGGEWRLAARLPDFRSADSRDQETKGQLKMGESCVMSKAVYFILATLC